MKTAVEWLVEQMIERKYFAKDVPLSYTTLEHLVNQAKEMEKEQRLTMPDYDLEDLATNAADNYDSSGNWHIAYELYKEGFQKAIELLTFKSE
jgi:hypothetical protein